VSPRFCPHAKADSIPRATARRPGSWIAGMETEAARVANDHSLVEVIPLRRPTARGPIRPGESHRERLQKGSQAYIFVLSRIEAWSRRKSVLRATMCTDASAELPGIRLPEPHVDFRAGPAVVRRSMHLSTVLVFAALIASVLAFAFASQRVVAAVAVAVCALQAILRLGLIKLSIAHFPLGIVLGVTLAVTGLVLWFGASRKALVSAATIVALVGAVQVFTVLAS
jgi:hypothetical protein